MDTATTPTPRTMVPRKYSINQKIVTILILTFICYIPTLFIQNLIDDRTHYQSIARDNSLQAGESRLAIKQNDTLVEYRSITRVTKYSILFISLTFALFFLFEVLAKIKIHPINYGLVGLALGVFYLLLLSFSELIGFIPAYLVAAGAVVLLICSYISHTLQSLTKTSMLATILLVLYGYLLILLQLEQYSLLFGSLLVFVTLSTIMLSTRNIDWYDV